MTTLPTVSRKITLAGFTGDPDWAGTGALPSSTIARWQVTGHSILWRCVAYSGVLTNSTPVSPAGLTVDACLTKIVKDTNGASLMHRTASTGEWSGARRSVGYQLTDRDVAPFEVVVPTLRSIFNPGGVAAIWIFIDEGAELTAA
jgi:hypothetical protein